MWVVTPNGRKFIQRLERHKGDGPEDKGQQNELEDEVNGCAEPAAAAACAAPDEAAHARSRVQGIRKRQRKTDDRIDTRRDAVDPMNRRPGEHN